MRPRAVRTVVGLLLLVLALPLLTGCGRLSKKEYIKKADAICRQSNTVSAKTPVPDKKNVRATADYLRANATLLIAQADSIDRLKAPKQDQPRLHDVFQRQRDALKVLQDAANQFQLGNTDIAQATANNANTALVEVRGDLQGYGFQDCANQ
ncbi:MAG TPA: hypothetical protein VLR26_08670 [Frankiaceae bacterium]|nr:hypothetical protein [Frankiaceae bacterium]